ncbi:hypothetical protein GQ53DRAFT_604916, partial [Thozetella sp. PMI_491]
FLDGESFGVKFVFTAAGVAVSLFWSSFFACAAVMTPYKAMSDAPQKASRSILLSPPTNPFSGIIYAIYRRQCLLACLAATAIISEFLPLTLSQIPYRVSQTFIAHIVCAWINISVLCLMVLVLVASFFVRWPSMPMDPTTVAGSMYYICDSSMMIHFEGVSLNSQDGRNSDIALANFRY